MNIRSLLNGFSAVLLGSLLLQPVAFSQAQEADEEVTVEVEVDTPPIATDGALPLDDLRTFADVFSQIRLGYVEDVDDSTLLEYAIQGMLSGLDPHSVYLTKDDFEDLQTSTSGEFSGLGLEVGMENGFVKVISPIDDTPADRAGIQTGDIILKLDNKPVKGMTLNEAIELMRGPRGSTIELTIARESRNQPFTLTLERDVVRTASVRKRWLEPGYGYVRIAQFQRHTGDEVGKAVAALMEEEDIKGIVLDLRNNPGGVLRASVDVADQFMDGGMVVYTKGRMDNSQTRYNATPSDVLEGAPIVVLINGGSASASEIVAGALQDHRRAVVMGTPSFGKGSVQTILPLSEERAIKLTTALYFTPNGRSIQAQGIVPDIEVERAQVTAIDNLPRRVTEADLNRRLDNANGEDGEAVERRRVPNELLSEDNQLYEALTLLKGIHILGMYDEK
ncbi:MAG: S41 family peptidase [Halieaceae bacterium]|jgi:carboxyl-terminal processing protease|nr:S41 family peptidase [Halieaceae bacterium]